MKEIGFISAMEDGWEKSDGLNIVLMVVVWLLIRTMFTIEFVMSILYDECVDGVLSKVDKVVLLVELY